MKTVKPIGYIKTDFKEKFGIPRQSGRVKTYGEIVFLPEYRNEDALRGIEGFNYLWILFDFSACDKKKWSPTVRPPRLGGNKKVGVFASRSPYRPNGIGLSSVKLTGINRNSDGTTLSVEGVDLLDGTPILDIKPYLPSDCHTDARGGYSDEVNGHALKVVFPDCLAERFPPEKLEELIGCLAEDPRPAYIDDDRTYGMKFCDKNVKFTVKDGVLTVLDAEECE